MACGTFRSGRAHLAGHRGKLHVHDLERIGTAAARNLATRQGHLCLRDVRTLTPAQARLLAGHVGVLLLSNLAIDERHRGPVHLDRLKTIDVTRAGLLASQCRANGVGGLDGLFLPHVKQLTAPVAAILATHDGGVLSLRGLESASGRGLALLWDNPDVILPPKLARPAAAIAAAGEAQLA